MKASHDIGLREAATAFRQRVRRWFKPNGSTTQWAEFQRRYFAELEDKPEAWQPILEAAQEGSVTLLYSARDTEHNNAAALLAYLRD